MLAGIRVAFIQEKAEFSVEIWKLLIKYYFHCSPYSQTLTFKHLMVSCQASEMYDTYLLHLKCKITCFIEFPDHSWYPC